MGLQFILANPQGVHDLCRTHQALPHSPQKGLGTEVTWDCRNDLQERIPGLQDIHLARFLFPGSSTALES